ncbi:MAG: hypothetical protein IKF65_09805 [Clostridia bacterium]|nr:hypothetical protein [Clostridia bacterium]
MKKHIFILLLASLLILCACVPTPEEPIVIGKDQSAMIEKAEAGGEYAASPSDPAAGTDWAARLGTPARYETSLVSAGGKLTVEVNAPIELPDVELPVVKIEPYLFTDADVRRYVSALIGDDPQCVDDPWDESLRTKKSYEKEILTCRDALEHWNEYGSIVYDNYETRGAFEQHLQDLMQKAANAPEKPETHAPTYEWQKWNVWTEAGKQETEDSYLTLLTVNEDLSQSRLDINRSSEYGRCDVRYNRDAYDSFPLAVDSRIWQNELSIGEQDARHTAETVLNQMGLDHLVCVLAKPTRIYAGGVARDGNSYHACWVLVFMPAVNGAAATYTEQTRTEPSDYAREWETEYCAVWVDEQGVAGLNYRNPCAIREVTVPAATLLPFDKIKEIFEKMVLIVDNNADPGGYELHYRITSIRLGLVSIPEQYGTGGLLVPAWDFMGVLESADSQKYATDEARSFLTINAVDGSIIVRG